MYLDDLLEKIRTYQFCAIDLNLYLDNFPDNQNAKEDYCKVSAKLTDLISEYEKDHGPMTNFGSAFTEDPKAWVEQPWPWENYK